MADDEIDDIGMCYFAALINGLRVINEKEADMGLPLGAIEVDGNALADYVAAIGDQQVQYMQTETEARIRWTPEERELVADEFKRHFPDAVTVTDNSFFTAQVVLPPERRYKSLSYSVKKGLMDVLGFKPQGRGVYQRGGVEKATRIKPKQETPKPQSNGAKPPIAEPSEEGDEFAESLSKQIARAVLVTCISALRLAANKLSQLNENSF